MPRGARRRQPAIDPHPDRVRIDGERGRRERDAVGHAGVLAVQAFRPCAGPPAGSAAAWCGPAAARASAGRRTATHRPDRPSDGRNRARARSQPRAWRRRRRSSRAQRRRRPRPAPRPAAPICDRMTVGLMPMTKAITKKPATRISDTRFEIVMVRRSLEAANAISAGNSISLMAFGDHDGTNSMTCRGGGGLRPNSRLRLLAVRLARPGKAAPAEADFGGRERSDVSRCTCGRRRHRLLECGLHRGEGGVQARTEGSRPR